MPGTTPKPAPNGDSQNGWAEYRRLVLAELERLSAAVAKTEGNHSHLQMAMTQALSDAKQAILDKLRDAVAKTEDENDRKIKDLVTDFDRKTKDIEARFAADLKEIKDNHEKTDKKVDLTHTDLTSLKAKALTLGAIAGFLVSLVGLVLSLVLKK